MSVEEYHKGCCSALILLGGQFPTGTSELRVQLINHVWRTAYSILKFYCDLVFCVGVTIIPLVAPEDIRHAVFGTSWPSRQGQVIFKLFSIHRKCTNPCSGCIVQCYLCLPLYSRVIFFSSGGQITLANIWNKALVLLRPTTLGCTVAHT